MPLRNNRKLFKGGGNEQGVVSAVKSAPRRRGTLRAAKMVKDGLPKTVESCCKCMYNTSRCAAIRKSNKKQCNYCAVPNSNFCGVHKTATSRAGIKL